MQTSTNGKGNNKSRDNWETPQWLFDILNNQYNFTFDCCANEKNTKCEEFSRDFEKLNIRDGATCWMNPPFSLAAQMFTQYSKIVTRGVAIYRADNQESAVWQNIIFEIADWIFIPRKRINYEGQSGASARFPSALIGVGLPAPKNIPGKTLKVAR